MVESLYFEANLISCTFLLAALTMAGIASAFMLLLGVALPLIIRCKLSQLLGVNFKGERGKGVATCIFFFNSKNEANQVFYTFRFIRLYFHLYVGLFSPPLSLEILDPPLNVTRSTEI